MTISGRKPSGYALAVPYFRKKFGALPGAGATGGQPSRLIRNVLLLATSDMQTSDRYSARAAVNGHTHIMAQPARSPNESKTSNDHPRIDVTAGAKILAKPGPLDSSVLSESALSACWGSWDIGNISAISPLGIDARELEI